MLRSIKDFPGVAVEGADGSIGRISDLYFDDQAWTIRFLVVETGAWLEGRKVLISPMATGEPDWARRLLPVSVTREQVRMSPDVDSRRPFRDSTRSSSTLTTAIRATGAARASGATACDPA